jgi:hypothetical protein
VSALNNLAEARLLGAIGATHRTAIAADKAGAVHRRRPDGEQFEIRPSDV